jgi:phosphorylcholine metabolism protein LicD
MKYKVLVDNRFGEGWKKGDIVEMDENSARVPLDEGSIARFGEEGEEIEIEKDKIEEIEVEDKNLEDNSDELIRFNDNVFQSIKDLMLFLNLFDAKIILRKLGLDFWLNNGTLLGYYRDGKFIDNDVDVDLGLFDFKKEIIDEFKQKGFKLQKQYGDRKTGLEYSFIRNGYKLDLFFFKKKKDGYYQYVWGNHKYSYKFPKFKLKKARFYGLEFNIPDKTEECLEAQYGDWKEKREDWSYINDPKNIKQEK